MTSYIQINKNSTIVNKTTNKMDKKKFEFKFNKYEEKHRFKKSLKDEYICVYSSIIKTCNDDNYINKYDFFPPPLDKEFLYGNILCVKYRNDDQIINLSVKEFKNYIKILHDGLHDLNSDSEYSEDSDDTGSLKDFIVDSSETSNYSDSDISESDSEVSESEVSESDSEVSESESDSEVSESDSEVSESESFTF